MLTAVCYLFSPTPVSPSITPSSPPADHWEYSPCSVLICNHPARWLCCSFISGNNLLTFAVTKERIALSRSVKLGPRSLAKYKCTTKTHMVTFCFWYLTLAPKLFKSLSFIKFPCLSHISLCLISFVKVKQCSCPVSLCLSLTLKKIYLVFSYNYET